ncbi:SICA antigen [Plasmodium coatneyi]|uniref:SICA antigen n=1 Tax=Plasmodium coatneyi TaxID=208452 RepID=A0A1B1DVY3_9APIC|nr:SICA antigen [Plasmodium coatneyi]ANQ06928.1 SICA antigen [Plasmodium coatneyi]
MRKRYRRDHQVRGLPSLEELLVHVDDQGDGPHEYALVKESRQPGSAPEKTKRSRKQGVGRRVGQRIIIDIHLEVLDECQKGNLHSTKEDFFEILVHEFMGCQFTKEDFVPMEHVRSSDSGFREDDSVPKECIPNGNVRMEGVPEEGCS